MPPMLGTFLFPSILNSFSNKNKGFNFKIKEFGSFANQKAVLNGEIDIAFTVIYEGKIDSNLEYIKLGTTELLFAVNKKNPLAKKENITLKELENYPIILMKEDSLQYQLVNQMFNKENINPDIVLTSNQLYIIKELLSNERNNYGAFIFKMFILLLMYVPFFLIFYISNSVRVNLSMRLDGWKEWQSMLLLSPSCSSSDE